LLPPQPAVTDHTEDTNAEQGEGARLWDRRGEGCSEEAVISERGVFEGADDLSGRTRLLSSAVEACGFSQTPLA
jgi:hypothetical protein